MDSRVPKLGGAILFKRKKITIENFISNIIVEADYDEEGNVKEYWTNRAYVTVTLGNDFVLGNEYFSGLADKKFSYKLDIQPNPSLVIKGSDVAPTVEG